MQAYKRRKLWNKNALQRNEISESRYQNFIKIYEELKDREEHKW